MSLITVVFHGLLSLVFLSLVLLLVFYHLFLALVVASFIRRFLFLASSTGIIAQRPQSFNITKLISWQCNRAFIDFFYLEESHSFL